MREHLGQRNKLLPYYLPKHLPAPTILQSVKFPSVQSKAEAVHYSMSALTFAASLCRGKTGDNMLCTTSVTVDILQNVFEDG